METYRNITNFQSNNEAQQPPQPRRTVLTGHELITMAQQNPTKAARYVDGIPREIDREMALHLLARATKLQENKHGAKSNYTPQEDANTANSTTLLAKQQTAAGVTTLLQEAQRHHIISQRVQQRWSRAAEAVKNHLRQHRAWSIGSIRRADNMKNLTNHLIRMNGVLLYKQTAQGRTENARILRHCHENTREQPSNGDSKEAAIQDEILADAIFLQFANKKFVTITNDDEDEAQNVSQELTTLKAEPIDGMIAFLATVDALLRRYPDRILEPQLETCLLQQMERFEEYKADIEEWTKSTPDKLKNYTFLKNRAEYQLWVRNRKLIISDIIGPNSESDRVFRENTRFQASKTPQRTVCNSRLANAIRNELGIMPSINEERALHVCPGPLSYSQMRENTRLSEEADSASTRQSRRSENQTQARIREDTPPPTERHLRPCYAMRRSGTCKWGEACDYCHDPILLQKSRDQKMRYKQRIIGVVTNTDIDEQDKLAPRSRSELCNNWKRDGNCKYGERCAWQHATE